MNRRLLWMASAAMIAASGQAWAQTAPQPANQAVALDEIVVTAQKREQNLQDVPAAVSAVSSEQLEARNVVQVTDVVRVSPSLTVTENTNATGNSINLRGIGTFSFSIGIEPSVAVVVDDVALLQQAQAFSGPQRHRSPGNPARSARHAVWQERRRRGYQHRHPEADKDPDGLRRRHADQRWRKARRRDGLGPDLRQGRLPPQRLLR